MKTRLLRLIHKASILLTVIVMAAVFLLALIRAEAPAVASELPTVTQFLSSVFERPVQIESMQLRWRHFLPIFDMQNISIMGDTPLHVREMNLGLHFILLRDFQVTLSPSGSSPAFSSSYFGHIILEQAVINFNQFQFKLNRLDLHKRSGDFWAWTGDGISLDFGKLFLAPLKLTTTSGKIQLNLHADGWKITAKNMAVSNPDIALLAKCELIGKPNESPEINLTAHYDAYPDAATDLKNYLPSVMHADVTQWLTRAIKNIKTAEGTFILKGKLSDFPFDKNPGEFLIDSNITDATLDYFKGWPVASHINTELIFSNTKMVAHVHSAELAHTLVQNIEVNIPVMGKKSVLNISGNISTDVENGLYFIHHSPLQGTIGKRLDGVQWTGPVSLGLQLQIPLNASPSVINGSINLKNTVLTLPAWKISLKNFTGVLAFSEKGFSSPKLTGSYSNSPVNITIENKANKNIYHVQYKKLTADVNSLSNGGWQAKIANSAWSGLFTIPENPQQNGIKGIVYFLNIDSGDEMSLLQQALKPSTLPPLSILIQKLRYKTLLFDGVSFQTRPLSNGLAVRNFQIDGAGYSVVGQGKWLDTNQSVLTGKLESNDLAKMISSWGLDPSIQGSAGEAIFSLSYPSVIYSPDLNHLSGKIDLYVGKGEVITTGSQAKMDFGRLLTLLSFQSIQRRLTLDFTDLTHKGLSFDSIKGLVLLNNNGQANVKSLTMKSSVAQVELTGNIDIAHQTYNLDVMVIPHLTSSLPIVATIAGGPVAGAAVWAASKVVNPILNKVTEDHYRVTGPWHNPVIKKE